MALDPADIPVMILCGGKGTRLREETEHKPKPMVEIGGKPIVWHIMKHFGRHGFKRFILCLGYKGNLIRQYFLNYRLFTTDFTVELGHEGLAVDIHEPCREDWTVTLAETGEDTMTGGRVHRALRHVKGDRFLLTYGDGVSDVDLTGLLAFHERHGRVATVTGVRPRSRFGELIATDGRVTEFNEKPEIHQGRINGGFFVFDRRFGEYLSADEGCILERAPLERCAADRELMIYDHDGFWQCMDTFRDFELLDQLWQTGRAPWKTW
jgi:glucose-1-phosphate cytidylyltransferase